MSQIKTVLFDYDGVLSRGRFYTTPNPSWIKIGVYANEKIFKSKEKLADKWMRGQLTSKDVNKIIADGLGMEQKIVDEVLDNSISLMGIEKGLIEYAHKFKTDGKKVGIVTDNMDVFDELTVPYYKLGDTFSVIVNSSFYGHLKHENNGSLFDVAMKLLDTDYSTALLIDNSPKDRWVFEEKGGMTFPYTEFALFDDWAKINMSD